jgi:hypothetical protein
VRTVSETSGATVPSARHRTTAARPRDASNLTLALALALAPLCVARLDGRRGASTPPGAAAAVCICARRRRRTRHNFSRAFPRQPVGNHFPKKWFRLPNTCKLSGCRRPLRA